MCEALFKLSGFFGGLVLSGVWPAMIYLLHLQVIEVLERFNKYFKRIYELARCIIQDVDDFKGVDFPISYQIDDFNTFRQLV